MGTFPAVRAWCDEIHYEGMVVAHAGSTYCAARDTAKEPPGDDWILIAAAGHAGADAPVGTVWGKYDPARKYRAFDLVTFASSEWRAKRDDPGPLPGDGWAASSAQGKRGEKGERGERGLTGPAGASAPRIVKWAIDGYLAAPVYSDGNTGPVLDLRRFFEAYHDEAAR
jgi:hypothetical protein